MELLLWMWFYDSRWFFNFKISVKCYKNAWLIPLLTHIMLAIICFYYMFHSESPNCTSTIKFWLFSRSLFSVLISLNIFVFMFKISNVHEKENSFFENAKKIYPDIEESMGEYDFWIRRKSLISTPGILLLFLGIISLFWSYLIIKMYIFEDIFSGCDDNIIAVLNFNSVLIFGGNVPVLVIIFVLILIKILSFISAFLCPSFLASISKIINPARVSPYKSI